MLLSVIIPCYNESMVVVKTHNKLLKILLGNSEEKGYNFELIFIDDGSKDETIDIIKSLAEKDHHTKYISFSRNFGKEAAMIAGLQYASGDMVVIIDADLQHPPELIPKMIDVCREGYDQVIAKRNRTGDARRSTLFAKIYYKLVNHMIDVEIVDGVGDFRLLSRKAVNAILALPEYNRFSKGIFSWIGFKETTIEYENQQRAAGESKWSFKSLLSYGIDGLLSFNNKPLRLCFCLGAFSMFISLIYIIIILVPIIIHGISVPGYFTTVSAILLIGGIQLISIGVLGEYVGRIYYEVKRRPHYLIDSTNIGKEKNKYTKKGDKNEVNHTDSLL